MNRSRPSSLVRSAVRPVAAALAVAGALALASPPAGAQNSVQIAPDVIHPPTSARKTLVRDAQGFLHCVFVENLPNGDRPVRLATSFDGGTNWTVTPVVFNDATSALNGTFPTNACNAAIDEQGNLHVVWGAYHYSSNYAQYYRRHDLGAGTAGPIVDLSAAFGRSASTRTDAMAITVDANGRVYIVLQGTTSWEDHLAVSTQPFNAQNQFQDLGSVSGGYSAQQTKLAVDATNRVHCAFYRNQPPGVIAHRIWTGTAWAGASVTVGGTSGVNDYHPSLVADALGAVHLAYVRDAASPPAVIEYRRYDGTTWEAPIGVATFTSTQLAGSTTDVMALACEESTGHVYLTYRDYAGAGDLVLVEKASGASAFTKVHTLLPASAGKNAYVRPGLRGQLFPNSARAEHRFGLVVRVGTASPYEFRYVDLFGVPGVEIVGQGCPGSGGFVPKLAVTSGTPMAGAPIALVLSDGLGGALAVLLFGLDKGETPLGFGCSLHLTGVLPPAPVVPLGGSGPGTGTVTLLGALPSDIGGNSFALQAFVLDAAAPLGFAPTNGLKLNVP
ncbi:MAG: hypothetical protein ACF8XB_05725 [Planctomycetota bacterium JB042]